LNTSTRLLAALPPEKTTIPRRGVDCPEAVGLVIVRLGFGLSGIVAVALMEAAVFEWPGLYSMAKEQVNQGDSLSLLVLWGAPACETDLNMIILHQAAIALQSYRS
jgi:hypothetical protein